MRFEFLHPTEQIAVTIRRIYGFGMTTTSGGNISIRDPQGGIWITPAAVDKGSLRASDIVHVGPDGSVTGPHKPSSEFPFHLAIYEARPDVMAVVHAHPPGLVAYSIARYVPDTAVISQAWSVCGPVGYASYALPGSRALGDRIAQAFQKGYNAVVLENHGTVVAGSRLADAFGRFETLEWCARSSLEAATLGSIHRLDESQVDRFQRRDNTLAEMEEARIPGTEELRLRAELVRIAHRAYRQRLIISTYGTFSARLSGNSFLISPFGVDRYHIEREDMVLIQDGSQEAGKVPSRAVRLFDRIYRAHPEIGCIFSAQSPSAMAHAVAHVAMDTRTIPESYVVLRDIPLLPFDALVDEEPVVASLAPERPIVLIENDSVIVTGSTPFATFDRLEVCEFSAGSIVSGRRLGALVPMGDDELAELRRHFF